MSISDKKAADRDALADDGEQNVESASRPIPYVPESLSDIDLRHV
ncbi:MULTISPECIES: hypothetical protein [unclassified Rhodococcus (in: high G+C Gram-positive bacteria)]|nr:MULTISPECIES: hypothetical protein [unclassified Rhodococcus (in: high G+C Gram-positive bacteria)]MBP1161578.1 hypothetical protein [Rhodococcus sp. PvR099]